MVVKKCYDGRIHLSTNTTVDIKERFVGIGKKSIIVFPEDAIISEGEYTEEEIIKNFNVEEYENKSYYIHIKR